jgi:hypothetical protein
VVKGPGPLVLAPSWHPLSWQLAWMIGCTVAAKVAATPSQLLPPPPPPGSTGSSFLLEQLQIISRINPAKMETDFFIFQMLVPVFYEEGFCKVALIATDN